MINCVQHFEILTSCGDKLLAHFVHGFKFAVLKSVHDTQHAHAQHLIGANSIRLLITSLTHSPPLTQGSSSSFSSLVALGRHDRATHDLVLAKRNTVFDVAFRVADLDRILFNCRRHGVPIIHSSASSRLYDNRFEQCAIIRSCVDGVVHTLYQTTPAAAATAEEEAYGSINSPSSSSLLTHFDHLTYATHAHTSPRLIQWYCDIFHMRPFRSNVNATSPSATTNADGLVVRTGSSGMNIKVLKYWLCAETGVHSSPDQQHSTFNLVISEPLVTDEQEEETEEEDSKTKNQIDIFLEANGGPGVQHIGLHSSDICATVAESKAECDYFVAPDSYYSDAAKRAEMRRCGLDADVLRANHVLLDAEIDGFDDDDDDDDGDEEETEEEEDEDSEGTSTSSYLLQAFTLPVFDKNTLFLEIIQRVGNAKGFGAANIKALWNAVQIKINEK